MPVLDSAELAIERCGLVEYEAALALQRDIHLEVSALSRANTLLLLEHPSIYTAGKRTLPHERPIGSIPVLDVDRGGKITWHGPGQLVGYPIVRLKNRYELVGFVREIEAGLIEVCAHFGLTGVRVDGRSGVWIVDERGERKVAAIGIRVAAGTTMHGFALNVSPDLSAFGAIIPCGIADADVTSIAAELGREITIEEVLPIVEKYMNQSLAKVSA
jgi:lipoyl(octanoyl) transferase